MLERNIINILNYLINDNIIIMVCLLFTKGET